MSNRIANAVAAILLAGHAALLAWAATKHSPSIDEVGHMAAGLSHWQFGRFDLYRVNPPLVRLVATAPVALLNPATDWEEYTDAPGARPEFNCGARFVHCNGRRSFWLFTIARWACIPFSLLGGCVCHRWAAELYGRQGALLALALWCFSPNILAHAQMITPDVGAAALGAGACYLLWRWLRRPDLPRALAAGGALGLAQLSKATFVTLYAVWPLIWVVWQATGAGRGCVAATRPLRQATQLGCMILLSVYITNMGYAFEGSFSRLGEFDFMSQTLNRRDQTAMPGERTRNRFVGTWLESVRAPFPRNYLLGIDQQNFEFERGYQSYLRGEWRQGGWWYYYLYGLAIKVPLGCWLLLLMAASMGIVRRDEVVLLLPPFIILVLVSSQTGFNHHLRYVLPIFPFCFVWVGRLGPLFADAGPHWGASARKWCVASALAWSVGESLWYYPHSLSYFNELAGGPLGGRWHMLDSNTDWGQDVLYLKDWLDKHPDARPLGLAYFGFIDPRVAGIEFRPPPRGPVMPKDKPTKAMSRARSIAHEELGPLPGWYAISVTILHGYSYAIPDGAGRKIYNDRPYYSYFHLFKPVATAGYSIYIYHLELPEVNRVRRTLGLAELHGGQISDGRK